MANEWIASLRIQTNVENKAEFSSVSPERYGRASIVDMGNMLMVYTGHSRITYSEA